MAKIKEISKVKESEMPWEVFQEIRKIIKIHTDMIDEIMGFNEGEAKIAVIGKYIKTDSKNYMCFSFVPQFPDYMYAFFEDMRDRGIFRSLKKEWGSK